MSHHRIFFWRYLAVGVILTLALGPVLGIIATMLAYWPTLRSARRTARRLDREVSRQVEAVLAAVDADDAAAEPVLPAGDWSVRRQGDALVRVFPHD